MKKSVLLLLSACFILVAVRSQNTSPYWSLAGNSNASASSKLGTTNAIPLHLFTNNVARATIATNGHFGIGTTSPQQRFHVEGPTLLNLFVSTSALGPISGSGQIGYTKHLPTAAGQRLGYFLTGSRGGGQSNYHGGGMVGYAEGAWSSTSWPTYLSFETAPAGSNVRLERVRITSAGNVGIGTASPVFLLDVGGRMRLRAGGGSAGLWLNNNANTGLVGFMGVATDNLIGLWGHTGAGWGFVMNTTTGHVGVGTLAPTYRLTATNNLTTTPTARIENLYSGGSYSDGLSVKAGRNSSAGSWLVEFRRPDNTIIGTVSQTNATSVAYNTTSDKRLKTNISATKFGLADIKKIEVTDYHFINDQTPQTGFLAQQLYEVFPDAVSVGGDDPKERPWMVDYGRVTPLLVKGLQELSSENEELKKEVAELRQMIQKLANGQHLDPSTSGATLLQNVPNPVKGRTAISYALPEGSNRAQLLLTDASGRSVKVIQLTTSGVVNVDVSSLSSGVYHYSLVVDGKTLQTRQLVVGR